MVVVVEDPLLLHVYVLAPLVLRVRVLPEQTGLEEGVMVSGGVGARACPMVTEEV